MPTQQMLHFTHYNKAVVTILGPELQYVELCGNHDL